MELETMIGYLVALAVPLWLVVEGAMLSQWSPKQPAKRLELGKLSGKPASGAPITATRAHAMRLAHPRKT
jgi:predicted permease